MSGTVLEQWRNGLTGGETSDRGTGWGATGREGVAAAESAQNQPIL